MDAANSFCSQYFFIGGVHHTTTLTRTMFMCPCLYAQCSAFLFLRSLAIGLAPCCSNKLRGGRTRQHTHRQQK